MYNCVIIILLCAHIFLLRYFFNNFGTLNDVIYRLYRITSYTYIVPYIYIYYIKNTHKHIIYVYNTYDIYIYMHICDWPICCPMCIAQYNIICVCNRSMT